MRKKSIHKLSGNSLVEVLVAFSILGMSLGIIAMLLNHSMFATFQQQSKERKAMALAENVIQDSSKTKLKWVEKEIYCTKNTERVSESGRIVKVVVRCYEGERLLLEKKAYQNK